MARLAWRRKAGALAGLLVSACLPASDMISAPAGRVAILLGAGIAGSLLLLLAGERRRWADPAADGAAFSIAVAVGAFLGSRGHPGFDLALGEAWLALAFYRRPGSLLPGSGAMSALWARDARAISLSLAVNSGLLALLSLGLGEGGFLIWFCSFVPLLTATLLVSRRKAAAAARASVPRLAAGADGKSMLIWEGGFLGGLEIADEGSVAVLRADSLLSCPQGPEALGVLEEALFRSGYRALLVTGAGPDQVRVLEEDGYARRGMGWHRILAAPRR